MDADGKSGNAVAEARAKIDATYENEKDKKLVTEAYDYAEKMHEGQKRASGEPYFVHPCSVANILMDMGLDAPTVAAAFLHDVVEDTAATEEDIREKFGEEVEELVAGVTKLNKIVFESKEQEEAENFWNCLNGRKRNTKTVSWAGRWSCWPRRRFCAAMYG